MSSLVKAGRDSMIENSPANICPSAIVTGNFTASSRVLSIMAREDIRLLEPDLIMVGKIVRGNARFQLPSARCSNAQQS